MYRGVLFNPLLPLFSNSVTEPSRVDTAKFWLSSLYSREVTGLFGTPTISLRYFRSRLEYSFTWPDCVPRAIQLMETPSSSLENVTAVTVSPTSVSATGFKLIVYKYKCESIAIAISPHFPDIATWTDELPLEAMLMACRSW